MTDVTISTTRHRSGVRRAFGAPFSFIFAVALPVVALARLLRLLKGPAAGTSASWRPSILAEAKSAASAAAGYAFMG